MRNKSVFLLSVLVLTLVSACTLLSKKELVNSFVVRVSAEDLFSELSMHTKDADFRKALQLAHEMQFEQADKTYTELFGEAYEKIAPETHMVLHFFPRGFHETIAPDADNAEVLAVLQKELDYQIDATMNVLRVRLDRYGLTHHYIQRIDDSEDILIELPEVEDPGRLKRLIETKGELSFWPTYDLSEVSGYLEKANKALRGVDIREIQKQLTSEKEDETDATGEVATVDDAVRERAKEFPLYTFLDFSMVIDNSGRLINNYGAMIGTALRKDTAMVNYLLKQEQEIFPEDLHFYWGYKPLAQDGESLPLFAIKAQNMNRAILDNTHITGASPQLDTNGQFEVHVSMNQEGGMYWKRLTKLNIKKSIAVMLDDYVYAYPRVASEVTGGETVIRGQYTEQEALDLANILQTGPLPLSVQIVKVDL